MGIVGSVRVVVVVVVNRESRLAAAIRIVGRTNMMKIIDSLVLLERKLQHCNVVFLYTMIGSIEQGKPHKQQQKEASLWDRSSKCDDDDDDDDAKQKEKSDVEPGNTNGIRNVSEAES